MLSGESKAQCVRSFELRRPRVPTFHCDPCRSCCLLHLVLPAESLLAPPAAPKRPHLSPAPPCGMTSLILMNCSVLSCICFHSSLMRPQVTTTEQRPLSLSVSWGPGKERTPGVDTQHRPARELRQEPGSGLPRTSAWAAARSERQQFAATQQGRVARGSPGLRAAGAGRARGCQACVQ